MVPVLRSQPATPQKAVASSSGYSSDAADASMTEYVAAQVKQASVPEPSPASTYGETVASDSVPATPSELNDDAILAHRVRVIDFADKNPSPQFLASMHDVGEVTIGDHSGTSNSKTYAEHDDSDESIACECSEDTAHSHLPGVACGASFAVSSDNLDPFVSNNSNGVAISSYQPRRDRDLGEVSSDNAQAIYPPDACVFVANLVQAKTDEELENSVHEAFSKFGVVFVKIKRDGKGMPYAFCQFTRKEDSEKAILDGRGQLIDGRQCRTERAKVNRSLYLSRVTGGAISPTQAREILAGRGDLERLWIPSPTDQEMFRLPDGIWVQFAFFQDCRDAHADFKENAEYRLEQPTLPDDLRYRPRGRANGIDIAPSPAKTPRRALGSPYPYRTNGYVEHRSIFIGNLPMNASTDDLRKLFWTFGEIRNMEVISRAMGSNKWNVFGFVEFLHEHEANSAIAAPDRILNGVRLRVQRKLSEYPPANRTNSLYSAGSPRGRNTYSSPDNQEFLWSREADFAHCLRIGAVPSAVSAAFDGRAPPQAPGPFFPSNPFDPTSYVTQYNAYTPQGAVTTEVEPPAGAIMYSPAGHAHYPVGQYPNYYGSSIADQYAPVYHTPGPNYYTPVVADANNAALTAITEENQQ